MDDVIPHPFASILFALVVGALFLWHGFEENQPPKRLAHVRPFILTEKPQATRLAQQIQPVPLRAETDISNEENLLPGHCAGQWHTGSRRRGHQAKRYCSQQGRRSVLG